MITGDREQVYNVRPQIVVALFSIVDVGVAKTAEQRTTGRKA
jgi:hypothetical protein